MLLRSINPRIPCLLAPSFLPGSTFTTARDRGRSLSFRSLAHIATGADEDFSGDLSAGRKKVLSLHRGAGSLHCKHCLNHLINHFL